MSKLLQTVWTLLLGGQSDTGSGEFDVTDAWSTVRDFLLFLAGVFVIAGLERLDVVDFGPWNELASALIAAALVGARRLIKNNRRVPPAPNENQK
jgi:hypothetical protein